MIINPNTKISAILKHHPDALEAIVSISGKLEKLRNPVLRKLMAGRASIAMASKMAGCSVTTMIEKLIPLGFKPDITSITKTVERKEIPDFMGLLVNREVTELDVRPIIANGKDPLKIITDEFNNIELGQVLKIINCFEPVPLMRLFEKQGFEVYSDTINDNLVETYFFKQAKSSNNFSPPENRGTKGWEEIIQKFQDKLQTIDVRNLKMPLPMLKILEELEGLPKDRALMVYHKRIPVYLLPELVERKFDYRIKEIQDGEVHLLIFKA